MFDEAGMNDDIKRAGLDVEKVRTEGNYFLDPTKYAEYRVPATTKGRKFVVKTIINPATGNRETVLVKDQKDW